MFTFVSKEVIFVYNSNMILEHNAHTNILAIVLSGTSEAF